MPRRRWLRVATMNTHAGHFLHQLPAMIEWGNPHVIALQEVNRRRHVRKLHRAIKRAPHRWHIIGRADNFLLLRRDRFTIIWQATPENGHGSKHLRYVARCAVVDEWTGRVMYFQGVHVDPLGKGLVDANPGARRRQTEQLEEYLQASAKRPHDAVTVDVGDWNQDWSAGVPIMLWGSSARHMWARVGMFAAHRVVRRNTARVQLDEVVSKGPWRPRVRVSRHFGGPHDVVLVSGPVAPVKTLRPAGRQGAAVVIA